MTYYLCWVEIFFEYDNDDGLHIIVMIIITPHPVMGPIMKVNHPFA